MSKIPYGLSDFYQLRQEDYIYIDKTRYIEILESYGEKYIFFLRPRRFGKTLFLSTLEYYYDLNHKESFAEVFSDLYIGQNKTKNASSYYILKFDFSGIETKENIETDFLNEIRDSINKFMDKYKFNFEYRKTNKAHTELQNFLTKLGTTVEEKVYLLIDEYDHFANEILGFETITSFENTVSKQVFLRKFFEVIKKKSGEVIDRLFVTGVSPITLDSMTSGFNIASNLTTDPNFNQALGFTLNEVKEILEEVSFAEENRDDLLTKLKEYYNGYLFSQYAEEKVFNSDMILYYCNSYQKLGREVDELVDSSIASDYSKMQNLFSLQNKKQNFAILEDIIAGNEQIGKISREFNLEKKFNKKDFLSLLFYLGFLTISREENGLIYFKVPNYAIKEIYFDFFAGVIENDLGTDALEIERTVIEILKDGKIKNFITKVEESLAALSNRDYINFDEKYIKVMIFSYLNLSELTLLKSEYEVADGYIDLALLRRNKDKANFDALIELKYIKKSDYEKQGEILVSKKLKEALSQLEKYALDKEFSNRNDLKKWAIIFAGQKAIEIKEVN